MPDTWPPLLGLVHVGVPEQYCWSIFVIVSAAVQNTWGSYNPVTWGEALVWTIAMVTVAVLFVVMVGFIVAAIRSSVRAQARYKEQMDTVMVGMLWGGLPVCCCGHNLGLVGSDQEDRGSNCRARCRDVVISQHTRQVVRKCISCLCVLSLGTITEFNK